MFEGDEAALEEFEQIKMDTKLLVVQKECQEVGAMKQGFEVVSLYVDGESTETQGLDRIYEALETTEWSHITLAQQQEGSESEDFEFCSETVDAFDSLDLNDLLERFKFKPGLNDQERRRNAERSVLELMGE